MKGNKEIKLRPTQPTDLEQLFLFQLDESTRPIFGRVAFDNIGSQRVREKCGFVKIGTERGFANARQAEIEEYIYKLI